STSCASSAGPSAETSRISMGPISVTVEARTCSRLERRWREAVERLAVEPVDPERPPLVAADQAGVVQQREVVRQRRAVDPELLGHLAAAQPLVPGEQADDPQPGRLPERLVHPRQRRLLLGILGYFDNH